MLLDVILSELLLPSVNMSHCPWRVDPVPPGTLRLELAQLRVDVPRLDQVQVGPGILADILLIVWTAILWRHCPHHAAKRVVLVEQGLRWVEVHAVVSWVFRSTPVFPVALALRVRQVRIGHGHVVECQQVLGSGCVVIGNVFEAARWLAQLAQGALLVEPAPIRDGLVEGGSSLWSLWTLLKGLFHLDNLDITVNVNEWRDSSWLWGFGGIPDVFKWLSQLRDTLGTFNLFFIVISLLGIAFWYYCVSGWGSTVSTFWPDMMSSFCWHLVDHVMDLLSSLTGRCQDEKVVIGRVSSFRIESFWRRAAVSFCCRSPLPDLLADSLAQVPLLFLPAKALLSTVFPGILSWFPGSCRLGLLHRLWQRLHKQFLLLQLLLDLAHLARSNGHFILVLTLSKSGAGSWRIGHVKVGAEDLRQLVLEVSHLLYG